MLTEVVVALALGSAQPQPPRAHEHNAIIYALKTGIVRRVIVPDVSDDELASIVLKPGEGMFLMKHAGMLIDPWALRGYVAFHTGIQPFEGRCAVVRHGLVEGEIMCDPNLDQPPPGAELRLIR